MLALPLCNSPFDSISPNTFVRRKAIAGWRLVHLSRDKNPYRVPVAGSFFQCEWQVVRNG